MYYPQVRKRRKGDVFAVVVAVVALDLFATYATSRTIELAGPVGAEVTNLQIAPECLVSGSLLEEAGAAGPTVSSVQSGGGERTIWCYYVKDVRRCRRGTALLLHEISYAGWTRPLTGLVGQAMTELGGSRSTTIIVQDGRSFLSVQCDGADKGFFGTKPAAPEGSLTVAPEVAHRFVSANSG